MPAGIAEPPTEEQPVLAAGPRTPPTDADVLFVELAAAVRGHQSVSGSPAVPRRPADHALYRLLDELTATPAG